MISNFEENISKHQVVGDIIYALILIRKKGRMCGHILIIEYTKIIIIQKSH
jgi:hypothetical protein